MGTTAEGASLLAAFLDEDLGRGDVTTESIIDAGMSARGRRASISRPERMMARASSYFAASRPRSFPRHGLISGRVKFTWWIDLRPLRFTPVNSLNRLMSCSK